MVRVEGGTFTMGCTPEQQQCDADENPARPVQVESFEIGRFEMTQALWEAVMGENPSTFGSCPRCPVETVSWDDVHAFLRKLNAEGERYRLPSEAEWEYAARGGQQSKGHQYAGSGNWAEVAWYHENSGNGTQMVGQKRANELGLFDMSGNVREWVQDCWHGSYDGAPDDGRARGGRGLQPSRDSQRLLVRKAELRPHGQPLLVHHLLSQQQPRIPHRADS